MGDAWISDYELVSQSTNVISADINEYHNQITDNTQSAKLSAGIRRSLVQLTKDIAALDEALRVSTQITEKEKARRGDLLRNLTTRKDQLSDSLSKNLNDNRGNLLNSGGAVKGRAWGQKPEETEVTRNLTNEQLLEHQKTTMQMQDSYLDSLGQSVARQKEIAITIDGELDVHAKLLDDLDTKTEKTRLGIEGNTKRIGKISEQSKVCGLWICIILLIALIIVFAATDWGCKIYDDKKHCS